MDIYRVVEISVINPEASKSGTRTCGCVKWDQCHIIHQHILHFCTHEIMAAPFKSRTFSSSSRSVADTLSHVLVGCFKDTKTPTRWEKLTVCCPQNTQTSNCWNQKVDDVNSRLPHHQPIRLRSPPVCTTVFRPASDPDARGPHRDKKEVAPGRTLPLFRKAMHMPPPH